MAKKLIIEVQMEFMGERYVPEVHGNIEIEHIHRYLQACEIAVRGYSFAKRER